MGLFKRHILLTLCLGFVFLIRLLPVLGNHFYFTIDQGRDAVAIRDILHGHLTLLGPQTSILNVYHGGLWYYFLVIPYLLFAGSPFGAVVFVILVSLAGLLLSYRIGSMWGVGLPTLLILSVYLPFYETSRYAFNPFLLPLTGLLFILALSQVEKSPAKMLSIAGIAVGLSFHGDLMAFIPFAATFFVASIYFFMRLKISAKPILIAWGVVGLFLLPHIISEIFSGFAQWKGLTDYLGTAHSGETFSYLTQIKFVGLEFVKLIGETVLPQVPVLGAVIFGVGLVVSIIKRQLNRFIAFTLVLFTVSFIWFSSNNGLRPWQIVYLPPILLLSLIAMIAKLPKKFKIGFLSLLFALHLSFTSVRIISYWNNTTDAGLLQNELSAIDWIYEKADGKGFPVYTYVPSIYDFHYQYLIYWRGKNKYGYVPCEYSTYPGIDASSYIKLSKDYQTPQKPCEKVRYLIMESAITQGLQDQWHSEVNKKTQLLEKTNVGEIVVEKLR